VEWNRGMATGEKKGTDREDFGEAGEKRKTVHYV